MFQKPFVLLCLLLGAITLSAQNVDVQHYRFDLTLNDNNDTLTGTAIVQLKLLQPADQFSLNLKSAKDGRGMIVRSIRGNNLQSVQHRGDSLHFRLKNISLADSVYTFTIRYSGVPADGLIIAKNKWGDRTFFADNWPDRAHHWLPCNDRPDDKASVDFTVVAPAHYRIISNGLLVEETALANDRKWTHWRETIPIPTKVMVIGAARFAVKNYDSVRTPAPVSAWVYPQDSTKGFYDYALAPSILNFFQQYIGTYAFEKLANVQSKTIFGGMENASAIFYAENSVTGTRSSEGLIAHEIAHQWFGNMATEKSFAHLWLSEGFATYMTHLYFKEFYPPNVYLKRIKDDKQQIIAFSRNWRKPVVDTVSDYMDLLNVNSYQKGSWVLHMLREQVGDDIFKKIVQTYYTQYKGRNADTQDFINVAEAVSGKDLKDFFHLWLYTTDLPQVKITWKKMDKKVSITVEQTSDKTLEFLLPVGFKFTEAAIKDFALIITKPKQTFIMDAPTGRFDVVLDPFAMLLVDGTVTKEQ